MTDTLDPKARIEAMGQRARKAARAAAKAPSALKDDALERMAAKLLENVERIAAANREDLEAGRAEGLSGAFLDRLALTEPVLARMAEGVRQIAKLEDPVGAVRDVKPRPSGILVGKMRVPLGVVAMIYESRPNVTIDAAALAVK